MQIEAIHRLRFAAKTIWQVRQASNLRPAVLETAALPIELLTYPYVKLKNNRLTRFTMNCHLVLKRAEFLLFKTTRSVPLVLSRCIVATLALCARQNDYFTRHCCNPLGAYTGAAFKQTPASTLRVLYSKISVTRPAPTVWPPSRIAKRRPFSMATGAMSSMFIWMLSPGMTIWTNSGSLQTPVTSVVRK